MRTRLPRGTIISYLGETSIVMEDDGGLRLKVFVDGDEQWWYWTFDGVDCIVVGFDGTF